MFSLSDELKARINRLELEQERAGIISGSSVIISDTRKVLLSLKEPAVIIMSQCRHTTMDSCFRYGGEEFSVILPELELSLALKVADRMRTIVENNPVRIKEKHPGTP